MITIIAALTKKRVIGKDNKLPWNIPDDLENFKKFTSGQTVIMGLNTFKSIGKPLPNRNNIVVAANFQAQGVTVAKNMDDALSKAASFGKNIFFIGGNSIFKAGLPIADRLILSWVKKNYEGDTYFPEFDESEWYETNNVDYPDFTLRIYERRHS